MTPRAGAPLANPPPITPPLPVNTRNKSSNPLDEKRPLPAIGLQSSESSGARRAGGLSTVPEHEEGGLSNRLPRMDVKAMAQDAQESKESKDVKSTQSSVAFTFDFGDSSAMKPAGRLPPLIREKTIRKSTEAGELKTSLDKRQQEADDRRQNELNSIAGKKKRRKVKLKSSKSQLQDINADPPSNSQHVVPPLDISSSPDKTGSQSSEATLPRNNGADGNNNATSTPITVVGQMEPRKGSANHDSTYGSDDENGIDSNGRVIDPLRRFSKRRGAATIEDQETVSPVETAQFFQDTTEQM